MSEKTAASDAPVWYSAEAASAWADGFNAATEQRCSAVSAELEARLALADELMLPGGMHPYLGARKRDMIVAALRARATADGQCLIQPLGVLVEINRSETTKAGVIDWRMEAERANRLLAEAERRILNEPQTAPIGYVSQATLRLLSERGQAGHICPVPAYDTLIPVYAGPAQQSQEGSSGEYVKLANEHLARCMDENQALLARIEELTCPHSQAGIEQRHLAQLLTILSVMKSAHSREPDRLMSIWSRDIEAVEAAVTALTRPLRPDEPAISSQERK
jgi:hypothetical protein